MIEVDPISYRLTDDARNIVVTTAGGTRDGDFFYLITGQDWQVKYRMTSFTGRYPYLRGLEIVDNVDCPLDDSTLKSLVAEYASFIEATALKCEPHEINATFHPERFL